MSQLCKHSNECTVNRLKQLSSLVVHCRGMADSKSPSGLLCPVVIVLQTSVIVRGVSQEVPTNHTKHSTKQTKQLDKLLTLLCTLYGIPSNVQH